MNRNERESYERWQEGFVQKLGHGIVEYSPKVAMGALVGFGLGAAYYFGGSLDNLLNPQLIDVVRENFHWYNVFTTSHAVSVVSMDHPAEVISTFTALGAIAGGIYNRRNS